MRKNYIKNLGFSLIEVVFAMSFLTLIILGVISLYTSNLAMMNSQNNQAQADFYANDGVQILRSIKLSDYPMCSGEGCTMKFTSAGSGYGLTSYSQTGGEGMIKQIFDRYIQFYEAGLVNAYKASVTVEWSDSTSAQEKHTLRVNTIIHK